MDVNKINPLLEEAFGVDPKLKTTLYSRPLQILFGNLIAEYVGKDLDPKSPDRLKQTLKFFFGDEINNWIKQYGQVAKQYAFIKDHYLQGLCFPGESEKPKETLRLIVIFNFLFFQLKADRIQYWQREALKIAKGEKKSPVSAMNFYGAIVINDLFFETLPYKEVTSTDFYIGKDHHFSQWIGIVKKWDKKRKDYDLIEAVTKRSLRKKINEPIISAIITGSGGTGKSTILRRLCYQLKNYDVIIIWLTSIKTFTDEISKLDRDDKYLFIIEDWEKIKSNTNENDAFFYQILIRKNIRIVIGDRSTKQRGYIEYVNPGNIFTLENDENPKIIEKVLEVKREWRPTFKAIFRNNNLYKTSLFLILFILARVHSVSHKQLIFKVRGIENKFKMVILYDTYKINESFPGLAKMLCVWANIHFTYKVNITWESFCFLANGFEKTNTIFTFDKDSDISKIVSYYLSYEPLTYPILPASHVFFFHHELLAEGLSSVFTENFTKYSDQIIGPIFSILLATDEFNSAASFVLNIDLLESEFGEISMPLPTNFKHYSPLESLIDLSKRIKGLYEEAGVNKDEWYWEFMFIILVKARVMFPKDNYEIKLIFRTLINNGCNAKCIIEAYDHANDFTYLEEMYQFFLYKYRKKYPRDRYIKLLLEDWQHFRRQRLDVD